MEPGAANPHCTAEVRLSVDLPRPLMQCRLGPGRWASPAEKVSGVYLSVTANGCARAFRSIQALLSAPNPDDPLAEDIAKQWRENETEAVAKGALRRRSDVDAGLTTDARRRAP